MKMFTVRLHPDVPKSLRPMHIAVDSSMISVMGNILEESPLVEAFCAPNVEFPGSKKFAKGLIEDPAAMTDFGVHKSILDAVMRINEERELKHGGCYHESFVGGPGDYSPPDCNCERCIKAGRSYRYQSFEISITKEMFQYFRSIFCSPKERTNTKTRKWGIEYTQPGKALICLYDAQGNMSIRSNKPEIRLGVYIFCHEDKSWRAAK